MDYDIKLLQELVGIDTNSVEKSNYEKMAKVLKKRLEEIGAKAQILYATAPDGKPRPNVIGYIDNGKKETVGLNAHYDVMPVIRDEWKSDPFALKISGDKAYGRGTGDDKAGIVVAMASAKKAKSKVNIEFLFTCDEETGSKYGLEWVMQNHRKKVRSTAAVVLDTKKKIDVGASGVAMGRITVLGKECHAGYAYQGRNAVKIALPFLQRLQDFDKIVGKYISKYYGNEDRKVYGRFNITVLNAGIKSNLIPGKLVAQFDMRSPPDVPIKVFIDKFKRHFDQARRSLKVDAKLEFGAVHDRWLTDPKNKLVKKFMKITHSNKIFASFGGNDGTYLGEAGIPIIGYNCGNYTAHESNEYVRISEMRTVEKELVTLLETF